MVTLNTTRYREVPTGKTSHRRSFFGKFILTVEMQEQLNNSSYPPPPPVWQTAEQRAIWNAKSEAEYEQGWQLVRNFYRDAREEDMRQPLLKEEFTPCLKVIHDEGE